MGINYTDATAHRDLRTRLRRPTHSRGRSLHHDRGGAHGPAMFDTTRFDLPVGAPQASTKCSALYLIEVLHVSRIQPTGSILFRVPGKNRS